MASSDLATDYFLQNTLNKHVKRKRMKCFTLSKVVSSFCMSQQSCYAVLNPLFAFDWLFFEAKCPALMLLIEGVKTEPAETLIWSSLLQQLEWSQPY